LVSDFIPHLPVPMPRTIDWFIAFSWKPRVEGVGANSWKVDSEVKREVDAGGAAPWAAHSFQSAAVTAMPLREAHLPDALPEPPLPDVPLLEVPPPEVPLPDVPPPEVWTPDL